MFGHNRWCSCAGGTRKGQVNRFSVSGRHFNFPTFVQIQSDGTATHRSSDGILLAVAASAKLAYGPSLDPKNILCWTSARVIQHSPLCQCSHSNFSADGELNLLTLFVVSFAKTFSTWKIEIISTQESVRHNKMDCEPKRFWQQSHGQQLHVYMLGGYYACWDTPQDVWRPWKYRRPLVIDGTRRSLGKY